MRRPVQGPLGMAITEVAARVGVHPETVAIWIRNGELSATRLGRGGKYWVSEGDLAVFLKKRRTS